jgi:hypothetical protein
MRPPNVMCSGLMTKQRRWSRLKLGLRICNFGGSAAVRPEAWRVLGVAGMVQHATSGHLRGHRLRLVGLGCGHQSWGSREKRCYPCRKRRSASRVSCSACLVTRAFVTR